MLRSGSISILVLGAALAAPVFPQTISIDCGSPSDQYYTGGKNDFLISYPGASGDLTLRYGAFQYHIPTSPGLYDVTLTMRETGTVAAVGLRSFSVSINGAPALRNFDLFAAAGLATVSRKYTVQSLGFVFIDFTYTKKSAVVSSITVEPAKPTNQPVEAGFGILSELSSPDALFRKFAINPSVVLHRVAVPVIGSPCGLFGAFAADAKALYLCVEDSASPLGGHWEAYAKPPSSGGASPITCGSSINCPVVGGSQQISVNTGEILAQKTMQAGTPVSCRATLNGLGFFACSLMPKLGAYTENQVVNFIPVTDCGASPSLDIDSLGPIPLKKITTTGLVLLAARDCLAGIPYRLAAHGQPVDSWVLR